MAETLTLQEIRDAIMGDAGLIIDSLACVTVDSDTYTINQLVDRTPDPFRMRDSYLYKPDSGTLESFSPTATLTSDISASVVELEYTSSGDPFTVGDIINIGDGGFEKMRVIGINTTTNFLTVERGVGGTTATTHSSAPEIFKKMIPEFRRITAFNYPAANTVDLARGFTFDEDFVGQIYFLISPDDINISINSALGNPQVRTIERTTITFVNNTNEYALPVGLHSKTQILGVYYRDASSNDVIENSAPAWKIIEDDNALTLHFIALPTFNSNVDFIVVWRKFFPPLAGDNETTTCPKELIVPKAEFELFLKIFKQHGTQARQMFAQDMALVEKKVNEYIAAVISPAEAREYNINEPIFVPDVLPKSYSW